ncbi:MAG: Gfo/Idh/MocA family oxidoreductase [Verrucomicrobia bacterium]|jgi:predicted dehydrogenase|nr:Gfo/Idh/MocA family oxidoreductase [Verrucomicrobiota bacterium]
MSRLKCAVIGLGMGRCHVGELHHHPDAEVVAVADLDASKFASVDEYLPASAGRYEDPSELLRNEALDMVVVAVPNAFHKPLVTEALRSGVHVLCEKPMAMNASEAEAMLAVSREVGRRLMINFSFRFTPQAWQMKKEVDSGALGEIYFARTIWHRRRGLPGFGGWFGTKALSGGGALIDLGVHRLDLALWLMGNPKPTYVMASTYDHIGSAMAAAQDKHFDVEDLAVALIKFENGATLEVEASWAANIKERELMETRLMGTRGGLVQRNLNEGYEFEAELFLERNGSQFDMRPHAPIPDAVSSIHHFVNCIVDDVPHTATAEEGVTVMKLLDAIYASAESGSPEKIG